MYKSGIFIGAVLAAGAMMLEPARAGSIGLGVSVEASTGYSPLRSNHPYAWQYPSNYPYSIPVTYNAGPGAYYPAKRYRRHAVRSGHRWTGYPPRQFYVTNYNGYAPQYGFHPYNDHYGYYR